MTYEPYLSTVRAAPQSGKILATTLGETAGDFISMTLNLGYYVGFGVTVAALAVILFGAVSFSRLKINLLPELTYPTLTVRTEYPGAAPAEIENLISKPIEESVGIVKNVTSVSSI